MSRDSHRHNLLQCLDVAVKFAVLVVLLCLTEFLTHIAAQILIRHLHLSCGRVFKAVTAFDDFSLYLGYALSELFCDVWNINTTKLEDTCDDAVLYVGRHWLCLLFNDTLAEYISLAELLHLVTLCIGRLLKLFKGEHVCIVHIVAEERNSSILVEMSVGGYKVIVSPVQFRKQRLQSLVVLVVDLVFKHFCKCFLDCVVCLEALNLCVPLYLVGIDFERLCSTDGVDVQLTVLDKHFANLLAGHCINHVCTVCLLVAELLCCERLHELCQHLFLLLILFRIQALACRTECVAFLKGKVHFTCHILGVLNEIAVVVHRELLDNGSFLALYLACLACFILRHTFACNSAHVNGIGRLLAVHTLANDNDVRGYTCAAESLVVHTESTDKVSTALANNPITQFLAAVKRTIRRDEDTQTALTQFAYVLCYTEVVNVVELFRQVFVACCIVHTQAGNKRNIGNSQVHATIGDTCLLKALYLHLCIGI